MLRRRRYDAVIDGLVLKRRITTRTMLLMAATGAPCRIGVGGWRPNATLYTLPVAPPAPGAHHVQYLGELARPFGIDPTTAGLGPELYLTAYEIGRAEREWEALDTATPTRTVPPLRLLVNLSAGDRQRRWPNSAFVAVLHQVREHYPGMVIGVIAAPDE